MDCCLVLKVIPLIFTARKRSLGQGNIFTPVCHSVHRGEGRAWLLGGACMVALGGHAWLLGGACVVAPGGEACMVLQGGVRGCSGGMHGCSGGACMVAPGGACMVAPGGHAWLLWGAYVVLFGGGVWFYSGGHAWFFQFFRIQWDTVNERVVRILLECILVVIVRSVKLLSKSNPVNYRLQKKLLESDVFRPVCHSVHGGMMSPWQRPPC